MTGLRKQIIRFFTYIEIFSIIEKLINYELSKML